MSSDDSPYKLLCVATIGVVLLAVLAAFMWVGMRIAQMAPGENTNGTDFVAWIAIAILAAIMLFWMGWTSIDKY